MAATTAPAAADPGAPSAPISIPTPHSIPHTAFPHIMDAVVDSAERDVLFALRLTSKTFARQVDERVARHLRVRSVFPDRIVVLESATRSSASSPAASPVSSAASSPASSAAPSAAPSLSSSPVGRSPLADALSASALALPSAPHGHGHLVTMMSGRACMRGLAVGRRARALVARAAILDFVGGKGAHVAFAPNTASLPVFDAVRFLPDPHGTGASERGEALSMNPFPARAHTIVAVSEPEPFPAWLDTPADATHEEAAAPVDAAALAPTIDVVRYLTRARSGGLVQRLPPETRKLVLWVGCAAQPATDSLLRWSLQGGPGSDLQRALGVFAPPPGLRDVVLVLHRWASGSPCFPFAEDQARAAAMQYRWSELVAFLRRALLAGPRITLVNLAAIDPRCFAFDKGTDLRRRLIDDTRIALTDLYADAQQFATPAQRDSLRARIEDALPTLRFLSGSEYGAGLTSAQHELETSPWSCCELCTPRELCYA